jgi:hypothetical protein
MMVSRGGAESVKAIGKIQDGGTGTAPHMTGPRKTSAGKASAMAQEFFVTCRVEKWFVDDGPESHGPYLSQYDAIADAIEAAQQLAKPKKMINVFLKVPGSNAELIWSSKRHLAALALQKTVEMEKLEVP